MEGGAVHYLCCYQTGGAVGDLHHPACGFEVGGGNLVKGVFKVRSGSNVWGGGMGRSCQQNDRKDQSCNSTDYYKPRAGYY